MKIKYIIKYADLTQTAYSGAMLDVLIQELLTWGAKIAEIEITVEMEEADDL